MAHFPLFADLDGRPVLIVGGGDVAARKVTLLLKAHAKIHVVAHELSDAMQAHAAHDELKWIAQDFQPELVDNAFLVIAATDDHALNLAVKQAADERHRLVNVVDAPDQCSFIVPAIIDRAPITVAISSAGKAPVLIRTLRERLESLLPMHLGPMAEIASRWRDRVKQRFSRMSDRRRFWEQAFKGDFASAVAQGEETHAEAVLESALDSHHNEQPQGEVILVGAGPGDAGLLTLRGLQELQQADVVLFDQLVSADVLELVRRDAQRICTGKRAGCHSMPQEEINQLIVRLARKGQRVVRLKGGDPLIFGRGGEEMQAIRAAGIPYQVVPGITAASAATTYAGIPLTHREHAQNVMFMTGHRCDGNDAPDWQDLARHHQTLAIYMGTVKAAEISAQLIRHGRHASTPVAVISNATRADQKVRLGRLDQLATLAAEAERPALLVIGEVVTLHNELAWFRTPYRLDIQNVPLVNLA